MRCFIRILGAGVVLVALTLAGCGRPTESSSANTVVKDRPNATVVGKKGLTVPPLQMPPKK
jgi:hypothetical protein